MVEVGQHVRIGQHGVQTFVVLEIREGGVLIESVLDAPGKYPFQLRAVDLYPVEGVG